MLGVWSSSRRRGPGALVLAVVGLGAANFLWQLGSSSFFVDEVLSLEHALPSLSKLTSTVTKSETTPWTYFWGLHGWLHLTGSQSEWVARLPGALAGVALVAAVYWMARAFGDARTGLLAALLTSLSPLVVTYAQLVRVYVFVLLALTIAVGLTLRATQKRSRWSRQLSGGAGAAVLAIWLHYTAVLVVVPLCLWLLAQRTLPIRARIAFVATCALAGLAELPLFLRQYHSAPNGGVGATSRMTGLNLVRVLETPFDGRFVASVNVFRIIALVGLAAAVGVLMAGPGGRVRAPRLLAVLGITPPLAIVILGLAGKDVVITRYTVVAAPMLLTAMAAAITSIPRLPALLLAGLSLTAVLWGLVRVHERTGFYAPAQESIQYIAAHPQANAILALPGHPGADIPLGFYAQRLLRPPPAFIETTQRAAVLEVLHERRPLWSVVERHSLNARPGAIRRVLDRALSRYGYTAALVRPFVTSTTFLVALLAPRPAKARHRPGGAA